MKALRILWLMLLTLSVSGRTSLADWCSKGSLAQDYDRDVVCVDVVKLAKGAEFTVRNMLPYPVTLDLVVSSSNMTAEVEFPYTATYPGSSRTKVATLKVANSRLAWRWKAESFHWMRGVLNATHDDTVMYTLPYNPGKAYKVIQAFHGTFSHYGADAYCLDWGMPEGTPVLATRAGIVVGVEDSNTRGGADESNKDYGNYVFILHADDTLAEYWHFKPSGVNVSVGQYVNAGDVIGLSGNTGWSSTPHLHFGVYRALDGYTRESLPMRFNTKEGQGMTLQEGKAYTAF